MPGWPLQPLPGGSAGLARKVAGRRRGWCLRRQVCRAGGDREGIPLVDQQAANPIRHIQQVIHIGGVPGIARGLQQSGGGDGGRVADIQNLDAAQPLAGEEFISIDGHPDRSAGRGVAAQRGRDGEGVADIQDLDASPRVGRVQPVPGHGHRFGEAGRVEGVDQLRRGRIGDIHHPHAVRRIRHEGIVARNRHAGGLGAVVIQVDLAGDVNGSRHADVVDAQAVFIRNIRIAALDDDLARRPVGRIKAVERDDGRLTWGSRIGDIHHPQVIG